MTLCYHEIAGADVLNSHADIKRPYNFFLTNVGFYSIIYMYKCIRASHGG